MNKEKTFTVNICGHKRDLPMCSISENTSIAAFIMFGDVEITRVCALELLKKCPPCDIFITAESKGIPLCYEMARQSGKTYVVARKSQKLYMENAIDVEVKSITTENLQKLYLSQSDFAFLKNKNVVIVDDVISTGNSVAALELLIKKAQGKIVAKMCALAEGEAVNKEDIISLGTLPLFKK